MDKCDKPILRLHEKHCQPDVVFNPAPDMMDAKSNKYPSLLKDLDGKDKQVFAAYIDVLPLKVSVGILVMLFLLLSYLSMMVLFSCFYYSGMFTSCPKQYFVIFIETSTNLTLWERWEKISCLI